MGWSVGGNPTRKSQIDERLAPRIWIKRDGTKMEEKPLAHCYRGGAFSGVLYIVWETKKILAGGQQEVERWIEIDLLQYYKSEGSWGYKDMCESMGPYAHSIPLSYLEMAPEADGEYAKEWRKRVRAYHQQRKELVAKKKLLKIGQEIRLPEGWRPSALIIISLKPLRGQSSDGGIYKISTRALAGI